jgi:hypothetical protein
MEITFPTSRHAARLSPIHFIVGVVIAVALATALVVVPALTGGGSAASLTDRSYDQVEKARLLFGSVTTQDSSYDQVEKARIQVVLPILSADHSYDDIERIRSQALPGAIASHAGGAPGAYHPPAGH